MKRTLARCPHDTYLFLTSPVVTLRFSRLSLMIQEAAAAAGEDDDEEYEPGCESGEDAAPEMDGLGEDTVPFINGRLDDEDEDEEPSTHEVSGHSNEDSSAKQATEVSAHTSNAVAENDDSNAKQPTAEVSGHARAENQDSSAKQPTAEVSGHHGYAGAENHDSSAKQPTAEVSGPMSGKGAVLASTAEASAQPELIASSDEEEVLPRRPIPTPARALSRQEHLNKLKQQLLQLSLCMQFRHEHAGLNDKSHTVVHVLPRKQKSELIKTTFRREGVHQDPSHS